MIRTTPDFPARSAIPREVIPLRVRVTGVICAFFTSAFVLAQDPKPAPPTIKDVVKKQVEVKQLKKGDATANGRIADVEAMRKAQLKANRDRMIQRYTQQGRPIVRGELLLVRTICQLNNEQLRPISRETEQTLAEFALEMSEQRDTVVMSRGTSSSPDACKQLQERLAIVIKKHLSPEQCALYKSEIDKRDANRKQAALSFLLDALDRDLFLSNKQQEKLRESLAAHWDDAWYLPLDYVLYGNQFYPMDLEQHVAPVLNENQKKTWQNLQKVQGMWGLGNNTVGANGDIDDLFAELGLAKKPQPKQTAK
jgi:hypothetical protein